MRTVINPAPHAFKKIIPLSVIAITQPLSLYLEVLEFEQHLPSIRMSVRMEMIHPTGNLQYSAKDCWFHCNAWDSFVGEMWQFSRGDRKTCRLASISETLVLTCYIDGGGSKAVSVEIREINDSRGRFAGTFATKIDEDIFAHIQAQFLDFDRWWQQWGISAQA